jgi:AraC-like DNA-binding protein
VALDTNVDPKSISDLARAMHLAPRTLQRRCRDAGTTARDCVALVRCLRALRAADPWDPSAALSLHGADCRTIARLVRRAGLDARRRPSTSTFLDQQRLVRSIEVLEELRQVVCPHEQGLNDNARVSTCDDVRRASP